VALYQSPEFIGTQNVVQGSCGTICHWCFHP